ncbi:hypothetical protein NEUTE1DRAFT_115535 [Neurospora tetrasperma FGSC 2508]|uniref:Tr-type G domain-containing protein n=1 Tax=Neurospora tetrasperma (strain FGSC 2508 / ATCC MYA-4615 / P0657) TaxID=510951 RepID=F8N025_NEUT8|nr:uncharacterized protein NEUTE1DRAFT_115535 [Neurospora tetrasperma FGSC 2508]EGO53760.1 hypothetical protein NEUTE1DRAFT_115535 [Neurospora tetrasperma FGSC 2508]EGZ76158.1 hypothetical protein NEUTE2DRAFT_97776 [Neurospora tetrasperma FGSC 2509]
MSVFTFDPNPPRVSSPWLKSSEGPSRRSTPEARSSTPTTLGVIQTGLLSDYNGITRLEAEPQEGPTEYKLHLLLRPRRKYEHSSTSTAKICGSTQSRPLPYDPTSKSLRGTPVSVGGGPGATTTRQDRFEHLTTQLLWRLQQSCPYHASSAAVDLVIPKLPAPYELERDGKVKLGKLLPGLEASRGALYEIGVADDGTLVGLTRDELDESLANLRVMAASLGCNMNVLRMVIVGECEWIESSDELGDSLFEEPRKSRRKDKLWVAEALIMPDLTAQASGTVPSALPTMKQGPLTANQLRVTLTGPTTSGKSTLLGILSQGSLDNGRGKSRLILLKHPHEVASGVTSSVAQALVGYHEDEIINDAHSGVESWIDVHDFTRDGRLVYLVDSAGAPRYRRTILRGTVGWAPHWTLLCIAADGSDASPSVDAPAPGTTPTGGSNGIDLASAHLELCLRLKLPLAIIITKLDLASKPSIVSTLNKVLTGIKRAGRTPVILKADATNPSDLTHVSPTEEAAVAKIADQLASNGDFLSVVPIVLTSAVDGRGLGMLHALLQGLPLPPTPTAHDFTGPALNPEQPASLFHIEDQYNLAASSSLATGDSDEETDLGTVVAGYLRFGSLSIGDTVVVGPFPSSSSSDDISDTPSPATPSLGAVGATATGSDSHLRPTLSDIEANPSSAELNRLNSSAKSNPSASASSAKGEWHTAKVVSIRNLQLPVQTLAAGQVGSIGMVFDHRDPNTAETSNGNGNGNGTGGKRAARIRKGMVLAVPGKHMSSTTLQAASGVTAVFEDDNHGSSYGDGNAEDEGVAGSLTVGSLVNVYVASVRASARVVRVTRLTPSPSLSPESTGKNEEGDGDVFTFGEGEDAYKDPLHAGNGDGDGLDPNGEETRKKGCEVQLELLSNREWIELGSRILILGDNGSRDRSSRLEGFVGRVVEIVE